MMNGSGAGHGLSNPTPADFAPRMFHVSKRRIPVGASKDVALGIRVKSSSSASRGQELNACRLQDKIFEQNLIDCRVIWCGANEERNAANLSIYGGLRRLPN